MTVADEEVEFIVDSISEDEVAELDADLADGEEDGVDEQFDLPDDEDVGDAVAEALSPGKPLFLVQRSHQNSGVLPAVMTDIARIHGGAIHLGAVAPMPRMSPQTLKTFFDGMATAPIRIADPEGFARPESFGGVLAAQRDGKPYVGITSKHWSYFDDSLDRGFDQNWVARVVETQRNVGATVVLTPGVFADPSDPANAMAAARRHAEWARSEIGAEGHLAVNLTLASTWLSNAKLRERLLNEILDLDEHVFYMRVRWPLMPQPYGQLLDPEILDGYIEVANVLDENDRVLILPNTGLTGWVGLAWGVHGFSTGIGAGERSFADTRVIKIKQTNPRPAPTNRTFVRDLLHVADTTTADLIESFGSGPCGCRFCVAQRAIPAGQWDKKLAGGHYLRKVADLAAEVAADHRGRRTAARRLVRGATDFVAAASGTIPLEKANSPLHLSVWAPRLR